MLLEIVGGMFMRKNSHTTVNSQYKIIAVDDEVGILDSLNVLLSKVRIFFCRCYRPYGSN